MKHFIVGAVLTGLLAFTGCGYKEGVKTEEKKSFLYFSGNTDDVTVSVDSAEPFRVKEGINNQYKVTSGKHTVRVYRGDTLVVERDVYLGDGSAVEIGVGQ